MDAPAPIYQNDNSIKEEIILNDIIYILKIINENNVLIANIKLKDIENADAYYESRYELKDLCALSKYFRQFDSIEEVIESLKNNKGIIKEKTNLKAYDINYDSEIMVLKLNLYLMTGKTQLLNIELKEKKLDDKSIINQLKEYIKYIKNIPGVNDLINGYTNSNIDFKKPRLIEKYEDFIFIEKELCKKLNKNEISLKLKFSSSKNGDSESEFHNKCDNIGPNLSIVKTKNNIIFGGFTTNNWAGSGINKKDDSSFIFNINNKKIYNIRKGEYAIYCDNNSLINFYNGRGGSSSLRVSEGFLSNSSSNTCELQDTSFYGFDRNYELNNGVQTFSVIEMDIYEVD